MNILSYRSSHHDGLAFELLIDEKPFGEWIGAEDTAIPSWLFEDDLPYFPPHAANRGSLTRIIAVCACGEYGCGRTVCSVVYEDDAVIFRNFEGDLGAESKLKEFQFCRANYEAVVGSILKEVESYQPRI